MVSSLPRAPRDLLKRFRAVSTIQDFSSVRHAMKARAIEEEALAPSRLAERMGMTRGAVSKLADRLIAKSLLVRTADPQDGRAQTLALTQQGSDLVPELAGLADRNDADFFAYLSAAERKTLERILKRIAEHCHMTAIPIE